MKVLILAALLATGTAASAETVQVKYSGTVPLDSKHAAIPC